MTGSLKAEIARAAKLLRELELLEEHNVRVAYEKYDSVLLRSLGYKDQWDYCRKNGLFDMVLNDQAILQFRSELQPGHFSFSYYQCPLNVMSYAEFLDEAYGEAIESVHDGRRTEYWDYLDTADLRLHPLPFRYDQSPNTYNEGVHPAYHMHVGHNSEVRLGTDRIMGPLSFVLFVVRQAYPDRWRAVLARPDAKILCRAVRHNLVKVKAAYWKQKDEFEVSLR